MRGKRLGNCEVPAAFFFFFLLLHSIVTSTSWPCVWAGRGSRRVRVLAASRRHAANLGSWATPAASPDRRGRGTMAAVDSSFAAAAPASQPARSGGRMTAIRAGSASFSPRPTHETSRLLKEPMISALKKKITWASDPQCSRPKLAKSLR